MPTKIEWADESLNIVTGCTKVSDGCKNCYAEKMSKRLKAMGLVGYHDVIGENGLWSGNVRFHGERLNIPAKWRKPRRVFLNSMSDTFHESLDDTHIFKMLNMIKDHQKHTFIIVTKRAERAKLYINYLCSFSRAKSIPNLWLLVSVEDQKAANERIPHLFRTNVVVRGLSMEPLLGAVDFESVGYIGFGNCLECLGRGYTSGHYFQDDGVSFCESCDGAGDGGKIIDWVIVGGESGPGARPMHPNWVRSIRDQCVYADIPFFFKQWGTWAPDCLCSTRKAHKSILRPGEDRSIMFRCGKKNAGRVLDGRTWDE